MNPDQNKQDPVVGNDNDSSPTQSNQSQPGDYGSVNKFLFGGSKNVGRPWKLTKGSVINLVLNIITIGLLVLISFIHYKHGDSWLLVPFLVIAALAIINNIYYGWIKREIITSTFNALVWNTATGGTAVAIGTFLIIGILIVAGVGWNWGQFSKSSNATTTQSQQSVNQ